MHIIYPLRTSCGVLVYEHTKNTRLTCFPSCSCESSVLLQCFHRTGVCCAGWRCSALQITTMQVHFQQQLFCLQPGARLVLTFSPGVWRFPCCGWFGEFFCRRHESLKLLGAEATFIWKSCEVRRSSFQSRREPLTSGSS